MPSPPKKKPVWLKDRTLRVRLSHAELETYEAEAAKLAVSLSEWARAVLRDHHRAVTREAGRR